MTSKRAILVISIAFVLPSCSTRQVGFLSIIFTIIFCLFSTTKTKVTKTDLSVAYSGRTRVVMRVGEGLHEIGAAGAYVLDKIRKNIFFGFIDYFYHIIDLFNRKFYL